MTSKLFFYSFFTICLTINLFIGPVNLVAEPETGSSKIDIDELPKWKNNNYPVKTPEEKTYDLNNNGWLEPSESKKLLQDKSVWYRTNEGTGVDMDLVREYDSNSNGAIDAREAEDMYQDSRS